MTTPFFFIIVPTFNRPEALTACVQTIKKLDYPQDRFEVIIVDDGSPVPIQPFDQNSRDGAKITFLRQINTPVRLPPGIQVRSMPREIFWHLPTMTACRLHIG